jgi:cation diffusion facilitator CzcD-associated flavoprotein CzcO
MPRFAIIGGGMAGILSAIKLQEAGLNDFTVYEKGECLGGTWRENTYPGVACDVPSHLYSYSFAPNPDWSHVFSPGPEIHDYFENVAARYKVVPFVRFGDEVTKMEFSDHRWHLTTAKGHKDVVDFVIAATGVLHHPKMPDIEGLDTFAGSCFHSARWDHSVPLAGARVGIIGTGSSAVQIIASLAGKVGSLTVFQRTPQWVLKVENPPIPEEDRERYRRDPQAMVELHNLLSRQFSDNFANAVVDAESKEVKLLEELCRMNLDSVSDPELKAKLTPDYRAACKRLVISPNFYEAMQEPTVSLVTEKILRCEPEGIRTVDGELHGLDVLVLATGFRVDRFLRPMEVYGRGGISLEQVWAKRPTGYLSISIPEFPNLFMLNGPNGPVGNFSLIEVAELQYAYLMQLVDRVMGGSAREVCATQSALDLFEKARIEAARRTIWVTGCKSWYLDSEGVPAAWPWSFDRFREEMAAPVMEHYEFV